MDTNNTRPVQKKKDEDPFITAALAGVREGLASRKNPGGERRARPSNMTEAHVKKIHAQRIGNAQKRYSEFMTAAKKDPTRAFDYEATAKRIMADAINANLQDLARHGVEMTPAQYRAQIGI